MENSNLVVMVEDSSALTIFRSEITLWESDELNRLRQDEGVHFIKYISRMTPGGYRHELILHKHADHLSLIAKVSTIVDLSDAVSPGDFTQWEDQHLSWNVLNLGKPIRAKGGTLYGYIEKKVGLWFSQTYSQR